MANGDTQETGPEPRQRRAIVMRLAALLVSYESDEPHVDLPHVEASECYAHVNRRHIEGWLEEDHYGDCTDVPKACNRCMAEQAVDKAEWLLENLQFE